MLIKPCPPCCTADFAEINVPDNFFSLAKEEQRNLLESLLNSHPEWATSLHALVKFIDEGNRLKK